MTQRPDRRDSAKIIEQSKKEDDTEMDLSKKSSGREEALLGFDDTA